MDITFPKYSMGPDFASTFSIPSLPTSFPITERKNVVQTSSKQKLTRSDCRKALGLNREKIPPSVVIHSSSETALTTASVRRNSASSEIATDLSESSLIDLSHTHTNASSLHDSTRSVTTSKFLLDDFFSSPSANATISTTMSIAVEESNITQGSPDASTQKLDENNPFFKLTQDLNFSCRETLNAVSRRGKLVSYEAKGSLNLKVNNQGQRQLNDNDLNSLLAGHELSLIASDHAATIKKWEISTILFESLPAVTKINDNAYFSKVQIIGDDRKFLFGSTGLNLYDYVFSSVGDYQDIRKVPMTVTNHLSAPIVSETAPTSSTLDFALSIEFSFPSLIMSNDSSLKLRGTKVQVSLSTIMSKVTITDITMQPSGSFDRNKRIITWMSDDFVLSTNSSKLEFAASIKYASEQTSALTANNFIENTFLPTMVRTQMQELLSGLRIHDIQFGNIDIPLKVSKSTQIEYKIA